MASARETKVKEGLIRVGVIGAARGLKGEVRAKSFTQDPKALGDYGPLTDETGASVTPRSSGMAR